MMADQKCPVCNADLKWKLSGRGKHFGGICVEHGIVAIVRHPLYPIQEPRKQGIVSRIFGYMMGQ